MGSAPFGPGGNDDGLAEANHRCAKDRPPDAKQLTSGDQRQDGDNRMQTQHMAHDARANDLPLEDVHDDEVSQDQRGDDKSPGGKGNQDTGDSGGNGAQDGNKFKEKGQDAQQQRVGHLEGRYAATNQCANKGGHEQLPANVAADRAAQRVQKEDQTRVDLAGRRGTQPAVESWPIRRQVDAEDEDNDRIHDACCHAGDNGHRAAHDLPGAAF